MAGKLGEILIRLGYVNESDIQSALDIQKAEGNRRKLGEILTEQFLKQEDLIQALTMQDFTPSKDPGLNIVNRILKQRLEHADIKNMLTNLSSTGEDVFLDRIADVLDRVVSFMDISNKLADTVSLDSVLEILVSMITDTVDADRGTLFLNDEDTGELFSRILKGDTTSEIRFPNHLGIAGSVFKSGEPVIIDDAYADSRFNQEVDRKTGYKTDTILCAPIRSKKDETIGVVQVLNKKNGHFSEDDLIMLEAMTSQASSALQKARLMDQLERARKEEEILLEVTNAISTELHLDPLLQKIMSTTTEILNADRSTLFMNDERSGELWSRIAQGTGMNEIRFPNHLGIAGSVFTSGETVNIPDAYADPRFNQAVDKKTGYKTNTILCMPVVNKAGTTIGVIQVLNKKGGPFNRVDEKRLAAFGSQASIAIENARLFEDVLNMKNYNEAILESMSNGVITLDAEGNIVKCNEAAGRIFQIDTMFVTNLSARELFSRNNPWVLESIKHVMEKGEQDISMDAEYILGQEIKININLTVVPLIGMEEKRIGTMLVVEDITKEKRLKSTMARYMAKEVADKLMEGGDAILGGSSQLATVLFSDIRSFTTLSERIGPTETVDLLNEYFTIMVDILFKNNGILDKYVGDAIMAVFGAPFSAPDDADRAVKAGVDMMNALREFNNQRAAVGKDPIRIGIGLSTAHVLSGNIGSLKRMDYTVIGDGVNLASRLEGANKLYKSNILISEFTKADLHSSFTLREADRIRVKGKVEPVGIYEVLDFHTAQSFPQIDDVINLYTKGLELYRSRNWDRAIACFEKALALHPKDGLSALYLERTRLFQATPPPEDWDHVWTMTTK